MLRKLALHRVGEKARDDVRRAWRQADQEAEHAAARDRPSRLPPLLAVRQQLTQLRGHHLADHSGARRREDFPEPEQPDGDRYDADAVAKLRDVEGIAE